MVDRRVPGAGPALQGRPLLDTRGDMKSYYVARPAVENDLRSGLRRGLNQLLVGPRGSGRTTILHRLLWEERDRAATPEGDRDLVLVRSARAETPTAFLQLVAAAVVDGWPTTPDTAQVSGPAPGVRGPRPELPTWNELATTDALIQLLARHIAERPRPVVLLVDDLQPELGNQVFGVLRDEIWSIGAQWLVTATPEQIPTLLAAPADAFFDAQVTIPTLTAAEAADILSRRLHGKVLAPAGSWTPRSLLMLAAHHDQPQWEHVTAARARQQTEIAKLGRAASMMAAVMEDLGPVSPSDPRLLNALGWTAARSSQVLGMLRDAGFVTYTEAQTGRPGRPARLYRLVAPQDVAQ